jgi:hypothetical protein
MDIAVVRFRKSIHIAIGYKYEMDDDLDGWIYIGLIVHIYIPV